MLVQSVQKIIQHLLENYRAINTTSREFEEYVRFWGVLKVDIDVDGKYKVGNVLVVSSLVFLKSVLKVKGVVKEEYVLPDFELFVKVDVEKDIFGDRQAILSSLVVKKFTVQR